MSDHLKIKEFIESYGFKNNGSFNNEIKKIEKGEYIRPRVSELLFEVTFPEDKYDNCDFLEALHSDIRVKCKYSSIYKKSFES